MCHIICIARKMHVAPDRCLFASRSVPRYYHPTVWDVDVLHPLCCGLSGNWCCRHAVLAGRSLLVAAGALCARGDMAVGWLFLLLVPGAGLGDTVNYSIGHLVGPRAFHGQNRLFKREHLERT